MIFLESYIAFNVEHLCQKWPNCFPDTELVFVKIENGNEEFYLGALVTKETIFKNLEI